MVKTYTTELAGRPLVMEFGKYCGQANGSVIVRLGDTVVMVNATASDTPREGQDFFPLSVDFEEKMYSVGKIPGGFIKREGRPSEKATLTSRLIDRPLRPLFNKGMRNDVQVVATILSVGMMLRHAFNLDTEADAIENAVHKTLQKGFRTGDIMEEGKTRLGTVEMGSKVVENL